jgi:hypothetical protein
MAQDNGTITIPTIDAAYHQIQLMAKNERQQIKQ